MLAVGDEQVDIGSNKEVPNSNILGVRDYYDSMHSKNANWNDLFTFENFHIHEDSFAAEKQQLLNQVTNLETHDLCPLVAAGCFTLTIFYARIICLQIMKIITEEYNETLACGKGFNSSPFFEEFNFFVMHPSITLDIWKFFFESSTEALKIFPTKYSPSTIPFESLSVSLRRRYFLNLELLSLTSVRDSLMLSQQYHQPAETIKAFLRILIGESLEIKDDFELEHGSLSSGARELEERILRQAGVNVGASRNSIKLLAKKMLLSIVEDCLGTFETAAASKDMDWIAHSTEDESLSSEGKARVLSSYFIMQTLIQLEHLLVSGLPSGSSIVTSVVVSKLVKLSSCQNSSLKFLLFDLASQILSCIIRRLQELDDNTYELKMATEYYLSIVKDHGLINALDTSLKTECSQSFAPTRLSKVSLNFLLQCHLMRRQLRLDTSSPANESFSSDWTNAITSYNDREKYRLVVNQLSAHSILVSWSIKSHALEEDGSPTSYSIHAVSMSGGSSVLLLNCIDQVGQYRLERLFSNSLYRICITKSKFGGIGNSFDDDRISAALNGPMYLPCGEDTDILASRSAASVCCSTESDLLLTLDVKWISSNLRLMSNVCVRNSVNKKWSTVRCSSKMLSGVYHWDVMIDRCISKNIFIGVVAPEARKDNYVGCDKYGWAFLANRAIWHNKSKSRAYGELFRSGDVVTATLDLDKGTLGFKLNSVDLGIAVTGLTPPLYAAFSLYNEGILLFSYVLF